MGGPLGVWVGMSVGVGGITFSDRKSSWPGTPMVNTLTVWLPGGTFRKTSARIEPSMIVSSEATPSSVVLTQAEPRILTKTVTLSPATITFSNSHSLTGTGVAVGNGMGWAVGTGTGVGSGARAGTTVGGTAVGDGVATAVGTAPTGEFKVGFTAGAKVAVGKAIWAGAGAGVGVGTGSKTVKANRLKLST